MERGCVLCIVGSTATGKSSLAVELAKHYGGEIISADSMQIYKDFNIGTAKITPEEMQGIPHYMIDIVSPNEPYSVARYCEQAGAVINAVSERGKLPIVVGGTGLYISSLFDSIAYPDMEQDPAYRAELQALADEEGNEAVWRLLQKADPESASALHPNNLRRVIRALEVRKVTGQPMSEVAAKAKQPPRFASVKIGLCYRDRALLYERIDRRVDHMAQMGLEREVRDLLNAGVDPAGQAMQAIGYKEWLPVLNGEWSSDQAIAAIKQNSRRYAKRQMTWFRRDPSIHWIEADRSEDLFSKALAILDM